MYTNRNSLRLTCLFSSEAAAGKFSIVTNGDGADDIGIRALQPGSRGVSLVKTTFESGVYSCEYQVESRGGVEVGGVTLDIEVRINDLVIPNKEKVLLPLYDYL